MLGAAARRCSESRSGGAHVRGGGGRGSACARDGINRGALLLDALSAGLPAREEVIRAVSGWLDDAERLERMR